MSSTKTFTSSLTNVQRVSFKAKENVKTFNANKHFNNASVSETLLEK